MININIKATGINQAIAAIEKVRNETVTDYRDFFRIEVEPELKDLFRQAFQSNGFGRWPKLAASTIAQKAREGFPSTPLVRTGYYRRSAERLENMRITRTELEITSPVRYAIYHENGTSRIPQREVFTAVARRIRRRLPRLYQAYQGRRLR